MGPRKKAPRLLSRPVCILEIGLPTRHGRPADLATMAAFPIERDVVARAGVSTGVSARLPIHLPPLKQTVMARMRSHFRTTHDPRRPRDRGAFSCLAASHGHDGQVHFRRAGKHASNRRSTLAFAGNTPPPELAEHVAALRKADAITDPLQRCLAYPDLPGKAPAPPRGDRVRVPGQAVRTASPGVG